MTPEEEQLMRAAVMREIERAGMTNPYAAPDAKAGLMARAAQSTSGQAAKLKQQQAMANALRNTQMPQGRTVGPSNIYVAPNWAESLAGGAQRFAGEYLAGKARQEGGAYDQLDEAETAKAMAGEQLADLRTQEQRGFDAEQAGLKRALDAQIARDRNLTTTRGQDLTAGTTIRGQDLTAGTAAATQRNANLRDVETVSFFNPKAGEPGEAPTLSYYLRGGRVEDGSGNEVDISKLTPYKALSPQALDVTGVKVKPTAAQIEEEQNAAAALQSSRGRFSNLDNLATYSRQEAKDFTGYNPQALLAEFGQGPEGVKAQQFAKMTATEEVGGLLPAIKAAKLTPVSDNDVKIVREQFVNARDQPETIAQFYAYGGRQFMDATIQNSIKMGDITPAEGQQLQQDYDKKAGTLAIKWGYDPQQLIVAGMDPELVRFLVEAKKRDEL